jgi:hypothetical protein
MIFLALDLMIYGISCTIRLCIQDCVYASYYILLLNVFFIYASKKLSLSLFVHLTTLARWVFL